MIYAYSLKGKRETNEDEHFYFNNINKKKSGAPVIYLSVFDGHGGKTVSKFLKKNLPKFFISDNLEKIYKNRKKTLKYLKTIFDLTQTNLEKTHPKAIFRCGSTSCNIVLFNQDNKKIGAWVANVGDSRVILCNSRNESKSLSEDHKPNNPKEKKRINELGGKIRYDGCDWRINDLSVSRAFGDNDNKPFISHLPEISKYTLNRKDKFIIIACDGLWDVISNQNACNFVLKLMNIKYKGNYAKKLAQYAILKGSLDNVSVIIYFFNN